MYIRRWIVKVMSMSESRANYAATLDSVINDQEEVVITRDNKPVATIRARPHDEPPRFGTLKGSILSIAPDFEAIPEGFEDSLP